MNVRIKNKQPLSLVFGVAIFFISFLFPIVIFGTSFQHQPFWVHLLWMGALVFWFTDSYLSNKTIKGLILEDINLNKFHLNEIGQTILDFKIKKSYPMAWVSGGVRKKASKNIMEKDGGEGEVETWQLDGDKIKINLSIKAEKRGWNKYPDMILSTTYPIGITKTIKIIKIEGEFLVYPEIEKNAPEIPKIDKKPKFKKSIDGDEVLMWRDYTEGDRLSSIDWKKSAKNNEIKVKEYMEDENQFHLEWSMVNHLEKEKAISRLTAWIVELDKKDLSWSLSLPNKYIPVGNDKNHLHNCLKGLALL